MSKKSTVVVAMSGGVDSSVAAVLLKRQGYDVIGVTMQIWQDDGASQSASGCCSLGAVEDARRVANRIGIPYYVLNYKEFFAEKVIDDFVAEYKRGRTPNPCINCNRFVKFEALLDHARTLGADFLATGHYSRIEYNESTGRWMLRKAVSIAKDQSYALYNFTQSQLSRTLMPLGDIVSKDETRAIAAEIGLNVARKPDSQEICFTLGRSYVDYLRDAAPETLVPGDIVDVEGNRLGGHDGIAFYTIGQRRRINVGSPVPLFVVAIDAQNNRIVVGDNDALKQSHVFVEDANWVAFPSAPVERRLSAKVRYNMDAAPCIVIDGASNSKFEIEFDQMQRAITPGQAAVVYDGDVVVGGGVINSSLKDGRRVASRNERVVA